MNSLKYNTMKKPLVSIALLAILAVSCDRPDCSSNNSIFAYYVPESKVYKDELIRLMKINGSNVLSYWFDRYEEKNGTAYIHVFVQGDQLCAKAVVKVDSPDASLLQLCKNKGLGYSGAELKYLQLAFRQNDQTTDIVYKSVGFIID
jgi:hypothetical protein